LIGHRVDLHFRQAPPADADDAVALRIQSRQLRAAAAGQRRAVRVRAGAGDRERAAPQGRESAVRGRRSSVKLACVVQRYGADIAGGSELHCRDLAKRLAARHEITVLTSCARDYVTWENSYPPGT